MPDLFNTGTSNNAPPPIPGGFGNPTGINIGQGSKASGVAGSLNLPLFGPASAGVSPSNPAYNVPTYNATNIQGLSGGIVNSNIPQNQLTNLSNFLGKTYGQGVGSLLDQLLQNGTFNPQVAAAFLNAQQPGIARGEGDLLSAFGGAGTRYSSGAQLGLGDYLSQVNLNQQQTLASLYENSQSQEMGLLQNILPTLHSEKANAGGGLFDDILGGLAIAGGIAAAPFTGGASLGITAAGVGALSGGNKGGGSSPTGAGTPNISSLLQQLYGGLNTNGSIPGNSIPTIGVNDPLGQSLLNTSPNELSAGDVFGGTDPFSDNGLLSSIIPVS